MNNILYIFLLLVLALNTLRYGTYLLEGDQSLYYTASFMINLITLLGAIIFSSKIKAPQTERQ